MSGLLEALRRKEAGRNAQAGDRHPHPPAHPQHHGQPDRLLPPGGRGGRGHSGLRHRPALRASPASRRMNSLVEALRGTERDTGHRPGQACRSSPTTGATCASATPASTRACASPVTDIYKYEIPGGQYTNLQPQVEALGLGHRFEDVKEMYRTVNDMLGDIIKVTPSLQDGGRPRDLHGAERPHAREHRRSAASSLAFPDSVVSYFKGMMGQPPCGFPEDLQRVVLKGEKPINCRPGELLPPVDWDAVRAEVAGIHAGPQPPRPHLLRHVPEGPGGLLHPPQGVRLHHAHGQPRVLQRHGRWRDEHR